VPSRTAIHFVFALSLGVLSPAAFGHIAPATVPSAGNVTASGPVNPTGIASALQENGPSTSNEWTWMGGSSTISGCVQYQACGQPGAYGTLGHFGAGNIPGGRFAPAFWTDSSGHFWMFGGYGYDSAGKYGYLNDLWEFNPSTNQWAWMAGSSTLPTCTEPGLCGQPGKYGALGSASTGNLPGGREAAATWTDASGNFWLFGGSGMDSVGTAAGPLNDLWEFDPATTEWTWKGGSDTLPSALYIYGQPGVYGTLGTPSASNIPGGRSGASTWIEDGDFWLFGGTGVDKLGNADQLNDLWEFNPGSGEWTWVSGNSEVDCIKGGSILGVYGTLGEAAAGNVPGARQNASSWTDGSGDLWLFGGTGWDANDVAAPLNDLWEFNRSTKEWAWQGGSSTVTGAGYPQPGVYGVLGAFAEGNVPGGRYGSFGWTGGGDFWLFGGTAIDNFLNDAWEFNTSTKEWAWTGGGFPTCDICAQSGVYGALGAPAPANVPGGRAQIASWVDTSGNVWVFGGQGNDSAGNQGYLNDMWEHRAVSSPPATATPTVTVAPSPTSITTAAPLTVKVTVSGGSGKPVPTGSITLTGGGYTSAATTMSGGIATIDIQAGYLLPAVDALTAYYTPDAASASTYGVAKGSGTVDVAATTAATAAQVGVSPVAYGIWTTETLPVQITVYGNDIVPVTGSVTLKGGSFTSAAAVLGGGIANISIPGGSLPAGTDTLTATYTPDANSVETYKSANGTASVVASVMPENQPEWAWMAGDNIIPGENNQGGVYGTRGVAAPANYPGGRHMFTSWTDSSGNFWIFGGEGNDGVNNHVLLNDLWKLDISTQEWTWVSGTSVYTTNNTTGGDDASSVYGTLGKFATGNVPGSREGASGWVDGSGNLWLFGGYGFPAGKQSGPLNDLWEFNPTTSEWAWMSGSDFVAGQQAGVPGNYGTLGVAAPGNAPAARQNASSWVDKNGNLWLFGGYPQDELPSGFYCNTLNDVWRFSPSNMEWAWMGGSQPGPGSEYCEGANGPPAGVYGTLGTFAAGNIPGGRDNSATWTDTTGNFWLFGGGIVFDSYGDGTYNDLWEFNPTTNEWAWMGGSNTLKTYTHTFESSSVGQAGTYGTLGTPASANVPGSRGGALTWIDGKGKLWLFGGGGLDSAGVPGELNDLWQFNPSTKEWTWMGGTSTLPPIFAFDGPVGIYGTLGEPAAANTPGGRYDGASFTDKSGNLWLFGGESWDALGQNGWFNDLWKYDLGTPGVTTITPTVTVTPASSTITTLQALSVTIDVNGGTGHPAPGGSVTLSSGSYTSAATTLSSGSVKIDIPAGSLNAGTDTLMASYTPNSSSSSTYSDAIGSAPITVNGIIPTVTVTPASSTITTIEALSVTTKVSGGTGNPTPAGSVTLTSGSYTSVATALSSGSAKIDIPAGSLAPGADTVKASYTPDSASASTYDSANGSAKVTVNQVSQTITFTQPASPVVVGVAPITLSATGGASGNPVTFSLVSGPGTLSGTDNDVLTVTATGTIVVAANQAGNAAYAAAAQVTRSVVVEPTPASLTSPTPGTVLSGPDVTFMWSAIKGAKDYSIWLGSTGVGSKNVYESKTTTGDSFKVTGLPTNGEKIYARLFTTIGSNTEHEDFTYTAASQAVLTSPKPGTKLTGSAVTFTWSAGTGDTTGYTLWLGSTGVGSKNLYNSNATTLTSETVTGLPTKGAKIYARLFTTIGGVTEHTDYTYTEK
jgi:N-acetylneuraminic acid mutarotase